LSSRGQIDALKANIEALTMQRAADSSLLPEVLARDRRLLDLTFKKLHRDYLRTLFTRYGKVKLSYLLDAARAGQFAGCVCASFSRRSFMGRS
jgi:hypothetical protein